MRFFTLLVLALALGAIVEGHAAATGPTISDFWGGSATFEPHAQLTRNDAQAQTGNPWIGGPRIVVEGGAWFLIHTRYEQTSGCAIQGGLQGGLWSRKSTDKGATWSQPVRLVDPGNFCAVVDGDLFWDGSKWRLLVQCLTAAGSWDGCYYEGSSLGTPFTAPASNPVIRDSENLLWRTLKSGVGQAGTFDIVDKIGSDFFVTYHGFNVSTSEGWRGLARTADFRSWTPLKVILGPSDSWMPVSAGFGYASTFKAGGYYYMAAESVERTLLFTWDQDWEFGLFRATSLSGPWVAWPGQPFIAGADHAWPAYAHVFVDGGETYRAYNLITGDPATDGVYIEKLVANTPEPTATSSPVPTQTATPTAIPPTSIPPTATPAPDVCEVRVRINGVEEWRVVDCEALP